MHKGCQLSCSATAGCDTFTFMSFPCIVAPPPNIARRRFSNGRTRLAVALPTLWPPAIDYERTSPRPLGRTDCRSALDLGAPNVCTERHLMSAVRRADRHVRVSRGISWRDRRSSARSACGDSKHPRFRMTTWIRRANAATGGGLRKGFNALRLQCGPGVGQALTAHGDSCGPVDNLVA